MKKKSLVLALIGLLLIALTSSTFAEPGRAGVNRKPARVSSGGSEGYYIWQDKSGFHIWATARSKKHVFSGVIQTDGFISHVRGHRLEGKDFIDVYSDSKEGFWYGFPNSEEDQPYFGFNGHEIDSEHDNLRFRFNTARGSDGLSFHLEDASFIDFDLSIDGHQISHRKYMLGTTGSIFPTIILVNSPAKNNNR
ncbi:MAG TPA: hypothetical protein PKA28_05485 [Methylomusa anaerophila]|uniref:Uncharacterized protein n=1 Tax=Methylomusa anaerophila TaxID=1930071 RepID=A0A348AM04_9FIRM|nr:hypothetical protein [Methylomusa anaerophila]BBB92102.1 hypothetical protein MAMMFC1_02787 [Methylomusa anaerophila]HML87884.1 hypothetical protein [Methylomusa anaerophila]